MLSGCLAGESNMGKYCFASEILLKSSKYTHAHKHRPHSLLCEENMYNLIKLIHIRHWADERALNTSLVCDVRMMT